MSGQTWKQCLLIHCVTVTASVARGNCECVAGSAVSLQRETTAQWIWSSRSRRCEEELPQGNTLPTLCVFIPELTDSVTSELQIKTERSTSHKSVIVRAAVLFMQLVPRTFSISCIFRDSNVRATEFNLWRQWIKSPNFQCFSIGFILLDQEEAWKLYWGADKSAKTTRMNTAVLLCLQLVLHSCLLFWKAKNWISGS